MKPILNTQLQNVRKWQPLILVELSKVLQQVLGAIDPALQEIPASAVSFTRPSSVSHGDFTTTIALAAAAKVGQAELKQPRKLAERILSELETALPDQLKKDIASFSVAGPGFINLTLSQNYLLHFAKELAESGASWNDAPIKNLKVMIEFTDPNPFKEFHIGHLYSNTVGESLARLLDYAGAEVKRVNYQGDVGMHVAKTLWGLKKLTPTIAEFKQLLELPLVERIKVLGKAYSMGATAYEEDESSKPQMQELNVLAFMAAQKMHAESGRLEPTLEYAALRKTNEFDASEIAEYYLLGRAWSLEYFETIYQRLGTKFTDYYFESLVGEQGFLVVQKFLKEGVFEESKGAVIFPGSKHGLHDRVFINSLGLPTYECKELGLASEKYKRYPYEHSIIVTANEISEYFKVLLKALELTSPELAAKTEHIGHGVVKLPEGKMSSRTGKILTGEWLLDRAAEEVEKVMAETRPEFTQEEREKVAKAVGLAAIKFALLKSHVGGDISFQFEESLSFTGFSGPYVMYSLVRALGILEAVGVKKSEEASRNQAYFDVLKDIEVDFDSFETNEKLSIEEKELLRTINQWFEVVCVALAERAPHHITTYIYTLAQAFNTFYTRHRVAQETDQDAKAARVIMTAATAAVLEQGLTLLGIRVVEKM